MNYFIFFYPFAKIVFVKFPTWLFVWCPRGGLVAGSLRDGQEARAPHALRCPLTHALLREPVRAADGYTYERANILDYFFANGKCKVVS